MFAAFLYLAVFSSGPAGLSMLEAFLDAALSRLSGILNMFSSICCLQGCLTFHIMIIFNYAIISFCIFVYIYCLLKFEDDDDFLLRECSVAQSGDRELRLKLGIWAAAPRDLGITPSAHSYTHSSTAGVCICNLSWYFIAQGDCIARKQASQTPQLFSELRIRGGKAWPKDHLPTIVFSM